MVSIRMPDDLNWAQLTSSGMVEGFEAPLPSLLPARVLLLLFLDGLPASDGASLTSEDTLMRRLSLEFRCGNLTFRRDLDMV